MSTSHENRFSVDLQRLLDQLSDRPTNLGEIEASMKGRGFAIFIIILTAPFVLPVTIPGLSTIFGLGIAIMGVRLSMGMRPWLPGFILHRPIQTAALLRILTFAVRIFTRLEKILRPRLSVMLSYGGRSLVGFSICLCGLLLALPLPPIIPFTNWFPGLAVFLLAAGYMERDGVAIILGYLGVVLTIAYFAIMAWVSYEAVTAFYVHVWTAMQNWFTGGGAATQPSSLLDLACGIFC